MSRAAILHALPLAALMAHLASTAHGQATIDCTDPRLIGSPACAAAEVRALVGEAPAHLACKGACLVRLLPDGAEITAPSLTGVPQTLRDVHFIVSAGHTRCMTTLGFVTGDGALMLYPGASDAQTPLGPPLVIALDEIYAIDPQDWAYTSAAIARDAHLSCDGERLFAPDYPGWGKTAYRVGADGLMPLDSPEAGAIMAVSPSGRYALAQDPQSGTITVRDYLSNRHFPTEGRAEIDAPFFDLSDRFLLLRRDPLATSGLIYNLAEGTLAETEADPALLGPGVLAERTPEGLMLLRRLKGK